MLLRDLPTPFSFCSSNFFSDCYVVFTGKSLCKSYEGYSVLLELHSQHQCQQDLQVHRCQALRRPVVCRSQSNHRRTDHRLLTFVNTQPDSDVHTIRQQNTNERKKENEESRRRFFFFFFSCFSLQVD